MCLPSSCLAIALNYFSWLVNKMFSFPFYFNALFSWLIFIKSVNTWILFPGTSSIIYLNKSKRESVSFLLLIVSCILIKPNIVWFIFSVVTRNNACYALHPLKQRILWNVYIGNFPSVFSKSNCFQVNMPL